MQDRSKWSVYAGFSAVDDDLAPENRGLQGITSEQTTTRFIRHLEQLARGNRPFLAWVHYFDPHAEYLERDGTPFPGETRRGRYLQEVFATDRELGRLFDWLEQRGYFESGYVFVFSDHGELIDDRGRYGHARWVDEGVLRGVLVARGPGVAKGRYDTRVRTLDVYPTALELAAGMRAPCDGTSLADIWRDPGVRATATSSPRAPTADCTCAWRSAGVSSSCSGRATAPSICSISAPATRSATTSSRSSPRSRRRCATASAGNGTSR